jgi:hypothetical protein
VCGRRTARVAFRDAEPGNIQKFEGRVPPDCSFWRFEGNLHAQPSDCRRTRKPTDTKDDVRTWPCEAGGGAADTATRELAVLFATRRCACGATYGVTRVHTRGSHVAARGSDKKTIPRGGGNDSQRSEEIWQRKPDRKPLAASEQFTLQDKSLAR